MQALQSIKIHASDSANEDDSPMANGALLQPNKGVLATEIAEPANKWSSKVEIPIGELGLLRSAMLG